MAAERSHPESVAQAALYTYGLLRGEARDVVIATMDTGSRQPGMRRRFPPSGWRTRWKPSASGSASLADHYGAHGQDPDELPERDFRAGSWQCRTCPFLNTCKPGTAEVEGDTDEASENEGREVSTEEVRAAVRAYLEAQEALREPEQAKRRALDTLKAWMRQRGMTKASVEGRAVSLVQDPALLGRLPQAERSAGPGHPSWHRDGGRLPVRAGELDASCLGAPDRSYLPSRWWTRFIPGIASLQEKEEHMSRFAPKTLRRMPPATREIARLANELASVQTRLANRVERLTSMEMMAGASQRVFCNNGAHANVVNAALSYVKALDDPEMHGSVRRDALSWLRSAVAPLDPDRLFAEAEPEPEDVESS